MSKFIKQHKPKMHMKNTFSLIDNENKLLVEYTYGLGEYLDEIGIPYEFNQQDGGDQSVTIHFKNQSISELLNTIWNLSMEFNQWRQKNNI